MTRWCSTFAALVLLLAAQVQAFFAPPAAVCHHRRWGVALRAGGGDGKEGKRERNIFERFGDWQWDMEKKKANADPRREEWIKNMMKTEGVSREVAEKEVTLYTIDPLGYLIKKRMAAKKAAEEGDGKKK